MFHQRSRRRSSPLVTFEIAYLRGEQRGDSLFVLSDAPWWLSQHVTQSQPIRRTCSVSVTGEQSKGEETASSQPAHVQCVEGIGCLLTAVVVVVSGLCDRVPGTDRQSVERQRQVLPVMSGSTEGFIIHQTCSATCFLDITFRNSSQSVFFFFLAFPKLNSYFQLSNMILVISFLLSKVRVPFLGLHLTPLMNAGNQTCYFFTPDFLR